MNENIDKSYNVNIRLSQLIVINRSLVEEIKEFFIDGFEKINYAAIGIYYKHRMMSTVASIENIEFVNMVTKAFRELIFEMDATDEDIGRFIYECLSEI